MQLELVKVPLKSHKAHRLMTLMSISSARHQFTLRGRTVHRAVCPFLYARLSLVLKAPTHGGMARLS